MHSRSSNRGDFLTPKAISVVEESLTGVPHEHDAILHALEQISPDEFIPDVSADELVNLFF